MNKIIVNKIFSITLKLFKVIKAVNITTLYNISGSIHISIKFSFMNFVGTFSKYVILL